MFVVSLTFLPLLAASSTALQSASKASDSFFSQVFQDESVWDALIEGALALIVFGAASAMLNEYRRRTPKSIRPQKAKMVSVQSTKQLQHRCAEPTGIARQPPAAHPPPGLARPRTPPMSAADAIASAVKGGNAYKLPRLLDTALARALAAAKTHGVPTTEQEIATPLLHSALRACAAARCFKEAIAAYDHMAERIDAGNSGLWSVLLYVIVEAADFKRCKFVFQKLCVQGQPSGHDFVNMVRCYTAREDPEGLREMVAELHGSGKSIDTYTWNRSLAACGQSERVLELAEALASADICGDGLDGVSYNTLMKYNARSGRVSRCFELHKQMLERGLESSEITYGILLDACVGAKKLDDARKVFDDLCSSGLPLNVVHCTTYIKGLVGAGKLNEAAGVLQEMVQSSGVRPDVVTYSTLIKGYADAGDVVPAMKIVEQMLERGVRPDEIIYNSVLSGCSIFPLSSSVVVNTFQKLISHGMRPSTTTLSILLKGLVHTQAWSVSLKLLDDAPKSFGLQPELRLFSQLAQACAKDRAFAVVLDVFDQMLKTASHRGETVDPVIVGRFIRSCLLGGSIDTAVQLRRVANQAGAGIEDHVEKMLKTAMAKRLRS